MMKQVFSILCVFMFLHTSAQRKLTSKDWQSDLKFLQETVHESFPFLFKKITSKDFDAKVEKFYNEIPSLQDHEIVVEFAKIISSFEYGHTYTSFRSAPVSFHKLPIAIYQFPEGVFITGVHKSLQSIKGARILSIEGKPMKDVLEAIYPVVPAENEQYFKAYGISYALIPEILHTQGITKTLQQEITLNLEKNGKTFTTKIKAVAKTSFPLKYGEVQPNSSWESVRDLSNNPLYLKNLEKRYFYEYLAKDKAVYVRYSQVLNDPTEKIKSFYDRVFNFIENNDVEKLILDVRLNSGGNNYFNKHLITSIIQHKKINFKGKLFVIIGRRTFSAAQNLINELDNYTNVTFVGEPSAENINFYGDSKRIRLPKSALNVYLSFAWWQDKPQWENADYTRPNLFVETSFSDYKANEDPVLKAILETKK